MQKPSLLIIDDEPAILKMLHGSLKDEGYRVTTLENPTTTISLIGELIPDLILLDIFMPAVNGLTLLEAIKKEYPNQKIIIISGFGNIAMATSAIKKGALDFIEKPLNLDEILQKLQFLKEPILLPQEPNHLEAQSLIGESYLFKEMIRSIQQLARTGLPLLIYGQHGTGKSAIARHIHSCSTQNNNFFLINCVLFDKDKLIELLPQSQGTVFFKNINLAPLDQQTIILKFIEQTKLRIIASSTQQLYPLQKQQLFLSSLFFKLNIAPIEIPPLAKRKHDIPLLINYFLEEQNHLTHKKITFSTASIRHLRNATWLGNVTQLKHCIQALACESGSSACITPKHLTPYLGVPTNHLVEEQTFSDFASLEEATNHFEKEFLLYHLRKSKFNLLQVSDTLDLKIHQLHAKMQKLNIESFR